MRLWFLATLACAQTPLSAQLPQPTARDTTFAKKFHDEANRKNGPRKTTVNALADSLVMAANQPPVARIALACDQALKQCQVNALSSTDDKVITGYTWAFGDGSSATTVSASHVYAQPGNYTIGLTVRDAEGLTSSAVAIAAIAAASTDSVVSSCGIAECPRAEPVLTFAKATRAVPVPAGWNLQDALSAAQPGDSLVLASGVVWTGNFVLPARPCGAGITITSNTTIPPSGIRVTPTTAAAFAKLVTPNSAPALKTTNPTCGWRLAGIEITGTAPTTTQQYGLLWLGDGGWVAGGETQTDLSKVPQQILLDRVYLHGSAGLNTQRCLYLNAAQTIVRDSWLSECHARGFDSQAILGCNGPGPYLIENNYLEGAGENVMFGGCDPVTEQLIPSDITIRGNHILKPLTWKGVWTVKNLFELKNARRVLVEGNVFENNWTDAQSGMAIVIKSSTETCAACTWEGSKDVTVRYNIVRNSPRGLNVQAIDGSSAGTTASHTERVQVSDNLFENIGAEGDAWLMLLTHDLTDLTITRNTFLHALPNRGNAITMDYGAGAARRLTITDNVMTAGNVDNGSVIYSGGYYGANALTKMAGTSWTFTANAIVGGGAMASRFPPGNTFPTTVPTSSPPGVDRAELARRTAGVVVAP